MRLNPKDFRSFKAFLNAEETLIVLLREADFCEEANREEAELKNAVEGNLFRWWFERTGEKIKDKVHGIFNDQYSEEA